MARMVLHGFALAVVLGAVTRAYAQEGTEDVAAIAAEAGVDATDLAGALNTLHDAGMNADARSYLIAEGALPAPVAQPPAVLGRTARVRLTHYVESGVTYSGGHPYPGSTACSWNFALGTRFLFPDGEMFVCNDRGLLGSSGWLDLWRRPDLVNRYGPFASVQVVP